MRHPSSRYVAAGVIGVVGLLAAAAIGVLGLVAGGNVPTVPSSYVVRPFGG